MIAIESIRRFGFGDVLAILLASGLWVAVMWGLSRVPSLRASYALGLLVTAFLLAFLVLLVRKAFSASLFFIIGAAVYYFVAPAFTAYEAAAFIVAGPVFELVFLALKLEIKSIPVDILAGTGLSMASIPLTTALFLSWGTAKLMPTALVNLILTGLLLGIAGALLALLLWHRLKTTKLVMRFEYSV